MPADFKTAHAHVQARKEYRLELALARTKAAKLCTKLLDSGLATDGKIPREVIQAMAEVFREAREVLAKPQKFRRKGAGNGVPGDLHAATKFLEDDTEEDSAVEEEK